MQQLSTFIANHWELFAALALILVALAVTTFAGRIRGIRALTPAEATRVMNHEDALMLDVRENNEFVGGHILDSMHIPLSSLRSRVDELDKFRERPIIVSCRSGQRSGTACVMLKKHGFENVFNLRGGVLAWQNDNLPLTKN